MASVRTWKNGSFQHLEKNADRNQKDGATQRALEGESTDRTLAQPDDNNPADVKLEWSTSLAADNGS